MTGHELRVTGHRQMRSSYQIRFDCPACDLSGALIQPTREAAEKTFRFFTEAHRQGAGTDAGRAG